MGFKLNLYAIALIGNNLETAQISLILCISYNQKYAVLEHKEKGVNISFPCRENILIYNFGQELSRDK
jgi:hypothetical protein